MIIMIHPHSTNIFDAQLHLDRAMRRLLLLAIGAVDVNAAGVLGSGAELRNTLSRGQCRRTGIRTLDYTYHIGILDDIGWYWIWLQILQILRLRISNIIQYHPIWSKNAQYRGQDRLLGLWSSDQRTARFYSLGRFCRNCVVQQWRHSSLGRSTHSNTSKSWCDRKSSVFL